MRGKAGQGEEDREKSGKEKEKEQEKEDKEQEEFEAFKRRLQELGANIHQFDNLEQPQSQPQSQPPQQPQQPQEDEREVSGEHGVGGEREWVTQTIVIKDSGEVANNLLLCLLILRAEGVQVMALQSQEGNLFSFYPFISRDHFLTSA